MKSGIYDVTQKSNSLETNMIEMSGIQYSSIETKSKHKWKPN